MSDTAIKSNSQHQIILKPQSKIEFKKKSDISDIPTTNQDKPKETLKCKDKESIEKSVSKSISKPKSAVKDKTETKPLVSKLEENFEFNEETINFFSKDLDPKKILIKHPQHSPFLEKINDTIIICLLLKLGHFKEYHCITSKCKVGKLWNGKPIQLILNRKNSIQNDLTITNLELICGNCFMITYGLDVFIKKKKDIILTCSLCNFPLVKFKDSRKKKGICLSCEYKIKQISHNKQEDSYFNQLKDMYSDNPVLSDDIKHTNYYSEVSKYKKFDNVNLDKKNKDTTNNTSSILQKHPIIELNMNIPDLSDLINDEEENNEEHNEEHNEDDDFDNDV